jgi:glycosyltransferase involved in cell wall biosynthesis
MWEDNEERKYIDSLLEKTIKYVSEKGAFDISLQVSIPNEWEKIAPVNIGVTAGIETTKVSPKWVEKSYLMDKILTISEHSKLSYENTEVEVINEQTGEKVSVKAKGPIEYVSYPVRIFEPSKIDLNLQTDFNFLAVAQLSPRKNVDQLIKCFVDKFGDNEDVGLIIKANMAKNSLIDRKHTLAGFKRALEQFKDRKCKIYLLHGYLNDNEMAGLYTHSKIKALISATHGEGFGLPIFEAAYYGLPVIATDWSGHLDFLYKSMKQKNGKVKKKHMFSRISYTLAPVQEAVVWDGVIERGSMWAHPEEGSIKMNLEEVYKDYGRFKKRSKELQKWVCEEFNEEKQYKNYINCLSEWSPFSSEEIDDLFSELMTEE